jgi:hypothetical protein
LPEKQISKHKLPDAFLKKLKLVTGKRAKIVIDHILKKGYITTEELKDAYGYNHPPRAIRDVKEQGIPILRFTVKGKDNRSIAAYKFDVSAQYNSGILDGRKTFSKQFKKRLLELHDSKCAVCATKFESRYLQIDHCIPFDVTGETEKNFMLLCGSCNRAKSWSCEHCLNRINEKNIELCRCCYWADPIRYSHIALRAIRRLNLTWSEQEIIYYDKIKELAKQNNVPLPDFIKNIIEKYIPK